MEIKAPPPKPIIKNNKQVKCTCHYLHKLGYPYSSVACRCGNNLTKEIKND